MRKQVIIAMAAALLVAVLSGYVWANDSESITAYAQVPAVNPTFTIYITDSLSPTTYRWQKDSLGAMDFGTLTNAVSGDPTSALAATKHFLVLVGVTTNTGKPYQIKYTGAPLAKLDNPTITLSGDAWTVSAGHDPDNTVFRSGITTGVRSAEDTYVVYNSNSAGDSDTIRLYFGITGDPDQAAGPNLIPPTQPAGSYQGTIKLDVYAL